MVFERAKGKERKRKSFPSGYHHYQLNLPFQKRNMREAEKQAYQRKQEKENSINN